MPRLLPRLTRTIQAQQGSPQLFPFDIRKYRPRRPKSLYKPTGSFLSFDPDVYPQSVLLESESPIATPDKYFRHKTLPPRVFVPQNARHRKGEHDKPRQMTEEERKWWSSPYLRMLASPPRKCALSGCLLPSAFLLRLAPMRSDNIEPTTSSRPVPCITTPDGLQHPKFTARRSNRSAHVICSRQAISLTLEAKKVSQIPGYVTIAPNLGEHISHLLRLRILQELELLLPRLKAKRKADILANPPIRRLSHAEWIDIQESRRIPWQDAVAVISLLPIPLSAESSMSPFPPPVDPEMSMNAEQPVATLYPTSRESPLPTNFQYRDVLPSAKVPLYDILGLFPHIAQRAAFCKLLNQLRTIYNDAQHINDPFQSSDAYVFTSNSETAKLADMVPLAIAMWRAYLYERTIVRE